MHVLIFYASGWMTGRRVRRRAGSGLRGGANATSIGNSGAREMAAPTRESTWCANANALRMAI
jgi:hypothetical protein